MNTAHLSIASEKLTEYLLNNRHSHGGPKARFFIGHGFSPADPSTLANALVGLAHLGWPGAITNNPYGVKYVIKGNMVFPDGTTHNVLTVWQQQNGSDLAELVSAYPT